MMARFGAWNMTLSLPVWGGWGGRLLGSGFQLMLADDNVLGRVTLCVCVCSHFYSKQDI